jgi:hypothetical protein
MKIVAVLLCSVLWGASAFAQQLQPGEVISKSKLVDGNYWLALDQAKKEIWLRAYVEGVVITELRVAIQPQNLDAEGNSKPWPFYGVYENLVPREMTWGDAVRAVDKFYSERDNLRILVSNALELEAMRARGEAEEEIQKIVVQERRQAAKRAD